MKQWQFINYVHVSCQFLHMDILQLTCNEEVGATLGLISATKSMFHVGGFHTHLFFPFHFQHLLGFPEMLDFDRQVLIMVDDTQFELLQSEMEKRFTSLEGGRTLMLRNGNSPLPAPPPLFAYPLSNSKSFLHFQLPPRGQS